MNTSMASVSNPHRGTPVRGTVLLTALLLAAVALTTGCRTIHGPDPTPGIYEPLYDRSQVRKQLTDAQRDLAGSEGVQQGLARAAVEFWQAMDDLHAQLPLPEELGRAREAGVLADYLRRVSRVARTAPPDRPLEFHPPQVELGVEDFVAAAETAAAEGRFEDAIFAAETLLDDLQPLAPGGTLAAELRYKTGLWHLAQGRLDPARDAFADVVETPDRLDGITDRARVMSEEIDLLLMLPDTPARGALARGWALLEAGDEAAAAEIARSVVAAAGDPETTREAEFLASAAQRTRQQRWNGLEARGRADVDDGPPFDIARESAVALAAQGAASRSQAMLDAVESAEAALSAAATAEVEAAWSQVVAESRELVAAERFRDAAALFDRFEGTELEERARREAGEALDIHVREERRRAGDMFVASQRTSDGDGARALLEGARAILGALLAEFPGSEYAERIQNNLTAVEQALAALGTAAPTP